MSKPSNFQTILPGLLFAAALGIGAFYLGDASFFKDQLHISALLLVIVLGMVWRTFLPIPESFQPGITFAQKPLLRWAVAGLGFKLSLMELARIGGPALAVVTICTAAALFFGIWIAKRLGVSNNLGTLLGVGGAVCGASAIIAADSVVQSEKSETACALGTVTLLGTLGILIYPILGRILGMDGFTYAIWNGASLHEMAQVVAAGREFGPDAEAWSTIVKLARICLLAPIVFYLAWETKKRLGAEVHAKVQAVPWFLVVFVVIVALNSLNNMYGWVPLTIIAEIQKYVTMLLCIGMAGVGLHSGFQDIRAAGVRPVLAGGLQWLFLSALSGILAAAVARMAHSS